MRRPLRLLHCADVHLDSDYYGGARNRARAERYRAAFRALLEGVGRETADLLLIAGDLFDHNRASAQSVDLAAEALAALPCPVVLIPGNHDCLAEDALYARHAWGGGGNLHLLRAEAGESLALPQFGLTLWGRGMRAHTPAFRPLAGAPAHPGGWHVGLAHGLPVTNGTPSLHASPITRADIAGCAFDYLALGHVHAPREVSAGDTPAWYPGSPIPGGREPGTFLRVDLTPGSGARVQLRTLPPL